MMIASFSGPRFAGAFSGFGAASPAVEKLQQVLKAYAQVSGNTMADPGTVDGIVGVKTRMAIQAVLPYLTGKISSTVATALTVAITAASMSPSAAAQIDQAITQYASQLTLGIAAITTYRAATAPQTAPTATTPPSPTAALPTVNTAISTARRAGTLQALQSQVATLAPGINPSSPTAADRYGFLPGSSATWYKTWWGMSLIGVGAVSLLVLLLARRD